MQKRVVYNFNAQTATESAAENSTGKAVKASNAISKIKRAFSGKSIKLAVLVVLLFVSLFCTIGSADWIISQQKNVPNDTDNGIFKFDDLGLNNHIDIPTVAFSGKPAQAIFSKTAPNSGRDLPDDAVSAIQYRVKPYNQTSAQSHVFRAPKNAATNTAKNMAPAAYANETLPDEKFFDGIEWTKQLPTEAGTYAVLITSKVGNVSYGKAIKVFTIAPCPVSKPLNNNIITSFIYDGTDKTCVLSYDTATMTISGNVATNAGNYTAIISLKDSKNYIWDDGTTTPIEYSWSISPKPLIIPQILGESSFIYTGSQQNINFDSFDSSTMTISGNSAINVGNYTATIALKDKSNFIWSNETTTNIVYSWNISKKALPIPQIIGNNLFSYDGNTHGLNFDSFDSSTMTISGNSETEAGNYTTTISLKDTQNYMWSNNSIAPLKYNWEISSKITIAIPKIKQQLLTYNGNEQTVEFSGFDESIMTKTGTHTSKNSGTYIASFELKDENATWSDGSTKVSFEWTIQQAPLTLTSDNITLIKENGIDSVNFTFTSLGLKGSDTIPSDITCAPAQTDLSVGSTYDIIITVPADSTIRKNYKITCKNGTLTVVAALLANYTSGSSSAYEWFVSLESAVASATSKGNVDIYVVYGKSVIVKNQNITLNKGVNLYLPYNEKRAVLDNAEDSFQTYINNSFSDSSITNVEKYRKTYIEFQNTSLTISLDSSVYIGGEFGSKGVSRYYGEIALDKKSHIICEGKIFAYGYIKELQTTNFNQDINYSLSPNGNDTDRYLLFTSTGYLRTPLVIYDTKSGSTLKSLVDANICPFNIFEFSNIQTFTQFNYGATMDAHARIQVGSSTLAQYVNIENVNVINTLESGKEALFKMSKKSDTDNGNLAIEYCPINTSGFTKVDASPTYIYINCSLTTGALVIKHSVASINTANYFLPFSYKMKTLVLAGATFNITTKVKYLPGTILYALNNSNIKLSSSLIFYKAAIFTSTNINGLNNYPSSLTDAQLIIDGTFICSDTAAIGAFIETKNTEHSAKLDFTKVSQANYTVEATDGTNKYVVKVTSSANFLINDTIKTAQFVEKETYQSTDNETWSGNYNLTATIVINIEQLYKYNVASYKIYQADDSNGTNATEITSGYTETSSDYILQVGKYIRVEVIRAKSCEFINNSDNYTYDSASYYLLNNDLELKITPNKGIRFISTSSPVSGSGSASMDITEKYDGSTTYSETIKGQNDSSHGGEIILIYGSTITYKYSSLTTSQTYAIAKGLYTKGISANQDKDYYQTIDDYVTTCNLTYISKSASKSGTIETTAVTDEQDIQDIIFICQCKKACLIEGTLITLADGTKKKVEDLTYNDKILVFNHETGKVEASALLVSFHSEQTEPVETRVINLKFSNGNIVRIAGEHGFFEVNLRKYVYIDESNVTDYLGHSFYSTKYVNGEFISEIVTLDSYVITTENVRVFSPATVWHFNIFAEDMLSMPADINGIFGIFDLDENFKYDEEAMQADIEKYGLYTYDDWKDIVPYEVYEAIPFKYFKVAIGKGYITYDEILRLYNEYIVPYLSQTDTQ